VYVTEPSNAVKPKSDLTDRGTSAIRRLLLALSLVGWLVLRVSSRWFVISVNHCTRQKQVRVVQDETGDKGREILFLDKSKVGYILHKWHVTVSTGTGLIFINFNIKIRKAA
jgi:hypothetical protein